MFNLPNRSGAHISKSFHRFFLVSIALVCINLLDAKPLAGWKWLNREWQSAAVVKLYASYASLYVKVDRSRDVTIWQDNELAMYGNLLRQSLNPSHVLLEATVYPTATLSTWLETDQPDLYHRFNITEQFNAVRSLGAGYQEPWSLSLFLGRVTAFWDLNEQDELVVASTGVSGLVLTGGFHQLFDNSVVQQPWTLLEWKLKGSGLQDQRERSWNLRLGYRWPGLEAVPSTIMLALYRQRTNRQTATWVLRRNSETALEFQLPPSRWRSGLTRFLLEYGKYYPLKGRLAGIKIGYLYQQYRPYDPATQVFKESWSRDNEIFLQPLLIW